MVQMRLTRLTCIIPSGFGVHIVNASPVYPSGHVHIGVCRDTEQSAPIPQEPGQGSRHFCCIQACDVGHSAFMEHSGLQFGGLPIYSGMHAHDGLLPIS